MDVGGVSAKPKFLFEGVDDEAVPFLDGRAREVGYEEVKVGEATCEEVGSNDALCVTEGGATDAVAYFPNFLVD